MHHTIDNYSAIQSNSDFRMDADYFAHPFRKKLSILRKGLIFSTIGQESKFIGSGHTPYKHDVSQGTVPFITVECIGDMEFHAEKTKRITPEQFIIGYERKKIVKGAVACTIKRRICKAYPFMSTTEQMAFNQDVALILPNSKILPGFLAAYFNSSFGQGFADSLKTEQMNPYISLVNLAKVPVPLIHEKCQQEIDDKIFLAQKLNYLSETSFREAQNILLAELGLSNWQPKHRLSFVKNYSEADKAGRIDAEYFQPKYDEIVKAIKSYSGGWDTLGNIASLKKCVEVGSEAYMDEGDIPFVRVSNLSPFEITKEKYISNELYAELLQHQPQQGEILFSKDGTPGIAYHLSEKPKKMIPSGGILRLQLKNKKLNEDYLTLVLNSMIVQEQINRDVGGSIILHWRPEQIKETLIPILPEDRQSQIQQKVTESFNLRKQSKHLLECAKRAVEIAIEQNEDAAIKWLKEQTKDVGS